MIDPEQDGVSQQAWREATQSCYRLRVALVVQETADARSFVLEIPAELAETFAYRPGQFLSFKIPFRGMVLTRSYSLASSPDCDAAPKFTVKRVDDGRVSNWINDRVRAGDTLAVTAPAGLFVLGAAPRSLVLFAGGSGITPVISIIKSALATTRAQVKLVYANRDERSIIFCAELEDLARRHPGRFELVHSLDDAAGFLDREGVKHHVGDRTDSEFYLCGPGAFMATVEEALRELGVAHERIHVERFVSPPDPDHRPAAEEDAPDAAAAVADAATPNEITIVLDGEAHNVPYEKGERVLHAVRRAGLEPPFSCEEGYCSCCMAKLVSGRVEMAVNDCLTAELLEEGWVLTCQSRCVSGDIRIEYPD